MGMAEDTCDFCGGYVDPIGCDTAKYIGADSLWDGQCIEGMEAQWGDMSTEVLTVMANTFQAAYDADPIDWNAPVKAPQRADFQRRAKQLTLMDTAWAITEFLAHREKQSSQEQK